MKTLNRRSKKTEVADADDIKQHYEKRIRDLELENECFKREIEGLRCKLINISSTPDVDTGKLKGNHLQRSNAIGEQVVESRRQKLQSQLSIKKHKSEEMAKQSPDEIQKLKAQKVQLQCKIKLDSVQYRLCKASLKKEILQLKKVQRRNEYKISILLALNQRQKLALQRKNEEAFVAMKRLKQVLESRKTLFYRAAGARNGNDDARILDIENELEITTRLQDLHSEYERQMEEMADEMNNFMLGAERLKEENSSCMLEENEVDCRLMDSELRDLKEEITRLASLVSQIEMPKSHLSESNKSHVGPIGSSGSLGSSIHSLDMGSSPSEHSEGNMASVEKSKTNACCSCSRKSLCKTLKCECRAASSSCGMSCGCAISKCTNREVSAKSDDSLKLGVTKATATRLSIAAKENSKDFASQPAEIEKLPDINDNGGTRKQPLHDISNALIKSIAVRTGRRKQRNM